MSFEPLSKPLAVTEGTATRDPAVASKLNFERVAPATDSSAPRMTPMPKQVDVGEQVIDSDHVFPVTLPLNLDSARGDALVAVSVDGGSAFSVGFVPMSSVPPLSSLGMDKGKLPPAVPLRFHPTHEGEFSGRMVVVARWRDGHVEQFDTTLIGRARAIGALAAPTAEAKQAAESARVAEFHARQQALTESALVEAEHKRTDSRPQNAQDDLDSARMAAKRAAEAMARNQTIGLGEIAKAAPRFVAQQQHSIWPRLAELAIAVGTAGVAKAFGAAIDPILSRIFEAEEEGVRHVVSASIGEMMEEGLKHSAEEVIKESVEKQSHEQEKNEAGGTSDPRDAFFTSQEQALSDVVGENAKKIDDRYEKLRPLLRLSPDLGPKILRAIATSLESAATVARARQANATAQAWVALRARESLGEATVKAPGDPVEHAVTDLQDARERTYRGLVPPKEHIDGLLDIELEMERDWKVRGARLNGISQYIVARVQEMDLRGAQIPMRFKINGSVGHITRDEAGRIRVSGALRFYDDADVYTHDEAQAILGAQRVVDMVLSKTLSDWGVRIEHNDAGAKEKK